MERRTALKNLSALIAGMALFPGCSDGLKINFEQGEIFNLTTDQKIWIDAISDAILPKSDVRLTTLDSFPDFVVKMINHSKLDNEIGSFVTGYNGCTNEIKSIYNSATSKVTPEEILNYFQQMIGADQSSKHLTDEDQVLFNAKLGFCREIRGLSIRHLTTSEEYQKDILDYKLVPDAYQACVTI